MPQCEQCILVREEGDRGLRQDAQHAHAEALVEAKYAFVAQCCCRGANGIRIQPSRARGARLRMYMLRVSMILMVAVWLLLRR